MTKMTHRRPITQPTTKRDGLANFVQMIINQIEERQYSDALRDAVSLRNAINNGVYDGIGPQAAE